MYPFHCFHLKFWCFFFVFGAFCLAGCATAPESGPQGWSDIEKDQLTPTLTEKPVPTVTPVPPPPDPADPVDNSANTADSPSTVIVLAEGYSNWKMQLSDGPPETKKALAERAAIADCKRVVVEHEQGIVFFLDRKSDKLRIILLTVEGVVKADLLSPIECTFYDDGLVICKQEIVIPLAAEIQADLFTGEATVTLDKPEKDEFRVFRQARNAALANIIEEGASSRNITAQKLSGRIFTIETLEVRDSATQFTTTIRATIFLEEAISE